MGGSSRDQSKVAGVREVEVRGRPAQRTEARGHVDTSHYWERALGCRLEVSRGGALLTS